MKKIIFMLVCAIFCAAGSYAADVPAAVKSAFAKKFPQAKNVKWGKENAKEFEADFVIEKTAMSANFSSTGQWLETETTISTGELPAAVVKAVQAKFPDARITGAARIESPGQTRYEAELKTSGGKTIEREFTPDGKPLS